MDLAVLIPAKGHSERLPRKNLRRIGEHSLVAISVMQGLEFTTHVYVSTDDDEIQREAERYGAQALRRPRHLCKPIAVGLDVIHYHVQQLEHEWFIYLEPTGPWRDTDRLKRQLEAFWASGKECGFSAFPWHGHVYKHGREGMRGIGRRKVGDRRKPTQGVKPWLIEDGSFYIFNRNVLEQRDYFWGEYPFVFETDAVLHIDTPEDLETARRLFGHGSIDRVRPQPTRPE